MKPLPDSKMADPPPPLRLGLYGGSFDPVHLGHLLVAQAAREELKLTRLFFIPAAQSPFKPGSEPAAATARLRLLRLALAGRTDYEIDTRKSSAAASPIPSTPFEITPPGFPRPNCFT